MAPAQHKKKGPNREHRCGAGQIPSKDQVRTSHNSRVLERGKLCVPWLVRVLGLLQQQGVNFPQWDQKSFPFRNLLEAYFMGFFPYGNPFGFCEAWRACYFYHNFYHIFVSQLFYVIDYNICHIRTMAKLCHKMLYSQIFLPKKKYYIPLFFFLLRLQLFYK